MGVVSTCIIWESLASICSGHITYPNLFQIVPNTSSVRICVRSTAQSNVSTFSIMVSEYDIHSQN